MVKIKMLTQNKFCIIEKESEEECANFIVSMKWLIFINTEAIIIIINYNND